jgi:hypothetical protein
MPLAYENATSGDRALSEIQKFLTRFGCARFGTMTDNEVGELIVQFSYRGRDVTVRASFRGYAAAWLKEHPFTHRTRGSQASHERKAMEQAQVSVCSVLRDWIKGQITAIETGILTFEGAFLGQILIPGSGKTVLEHIENAQVLPALEAPKKD